MLKKAINSVTCFSFIAFPVFLFFASCHTRSFSSNGQNTPLNKKTTSAVDAIPPIKSTQFITDKSNRSPTGVKVIGNSVSKVLKVRLSEETVCILNSNKELQCFGDTEDHYSLSRLSKRDVVDFSLGLEHACALNGGGEIICLGLNKYCQLGSPLNAETTIPVESPIMVENFEGKSLSITGGDRFTCALFESSFARCWGSNFFTELSIAGCVPGYKRGQSCIMGKRIPPDGYAKVLAAKSITAYGDNACIITASGQLYCWGRNLSSGLGANEDEYIGDFGFVPVSGIDEKVRSVSITNSGYAFAITKSEKVYCFRFSSSDNDQDLDAFRAKGLGDNVSSVAAIRHPSIICTSGKNKNIRCWNYGRIDPDRAREGSARLCQVYEIGTPESKTIPEPVAFYDQPFHLPFTVLEDGAVGDIVFSRREMCTATSSGGAVCWGNSKKARQILGAPLHVYSPVSLENNLGHIEELYAGENCSCFSTMSKRYQCRGRGSMYTDNLFSIVSSLRDSIKNVQISDDFSCAVLKNDRVKCWGNGSSGQLGIGKNVGLHSKVPVLVKHLDSVEKISIGNHQVCALLFDKTVRCWGRVNIKQPSGNVVRNAYYPTEIHGLGNGVVEVELGSGFGCALFKLGGVKCWGKLTFGGSKRKQSIDFDSNNYVAGLENSVSSLSLGGCHFCAVVKGKVIQCVGCNAHGELGDGTSVGRTVFDKGISLGDEVYKVLSRGEYSKSGFSCALTTSGIVYCWGAGIWGKVGDESTIDPSLPARVLDSVIDIVGGKRHVCALQKYGRVQCWGDDSFGQISGIDNLTPYTVIDPVETKR